VALSPRPAARPSDFSGAVTAAIASASREATRQVAAPQAVPEPEEAEEPEVQVAAAPRIPTRANVAQQATFKSAINLSKINLIGVYGTDSKRYALVRSASGRYSKVRVGDKLDGGTVAAITRSEVRYKKGSRMLSLAMPTG
jgi:type IV pilus biogenesis protein PilP